VAGRWLPFRRPLEVSARGKCPARPTQRPALVKVTPNSRQLHDWNVSVEIALVNPSHTGIRTVVQISANTLYESQPYLLYPNSESKVFEDRTHGQKQTVAQNACRFRNLKHDSSADIYTYTIHIYLTSLFSFLFNTQILYWCTIYELNTFQFAAAFTDRNINQIYSRSSRHALQN
jgi:hypothetical protein